MTTEAKKKQEVALIDANKRLAVAEQKLLAAQDLAAAIMAKGKADADVINFANEAEAAGWQKSIAAFSGNGNEFARWTLYKKLAPAFRSMMINTDNSPLMDVFKTFDSKPTARLPAKRTRNRNRSVIGKAGMRAGHDLSLLHGSQHTNNYRENSTEKSHETLKLNMASWIVLAVLPGVRRIVAL